MFQFAFPPSRLRNFFYDVLIAVLLHHLLKFLLVESPSYLFYKQVFKSISRRITFVAQCNDETFIGPILEITLLENMFVLAYPHFIFELEFPIRLRYRRKHPIRSLLKMFQSHIVGRHSDSTMTRFVVRVYESAQDIDPSCELNQFFASDKRVCLTSAATPPNEPGLVGS